MIKKTQVYRCSIDKVTTMLGCMPLRNNTDLCLSLPDGGLWIQCPAPVPSPAKGVPKISPMLQYPRNPLPIRTRSRSWRKGRRALGGRQNMQGGSITRYAENNQIWDRTIPDVHPIHAGLVFSEGTFASLARIFSRNNINTGRYT
jgi:hypothetical protein